MRKFIYLAISLLLLLVVIPSYSFAQRLIKGHVVTETGEKVSDVVVKIKGFEISTITEKDGTYQIWLPEKVKTIEFSNFEGRIVKEVKFISDSEIRIVVSQTGKEVVTDVFDLTIEELMNVQVKSVSKKAESVLKAPQTILVVTEQQIENRGYRDLEEVLHDLPGFDISRGMGTQYSQVYQRGYRSNNTDRTLLLVDGVEENDLWSGSVWLSRQYPLSNIKQIEVIYGPASTIYGANAFVGVINIVTKNADDYTSGKFGMQGTIGYGTWNTKYTDLSLAANSAKVKYTLTGRMYLSDEMDLSEYKDWNYDLNDYDLDYYKTVLGTENDAFAQAAMDLDNQGYYNDPTLQGVKPQYANATDDWAVNTKLSIGDFTLGYQVFQRDEGYGGWYRDDFELGTAQGSSWGPINQYLYAKFDKQLNENLNISSFTRFKVHSLADAINEEYYFYGYMNGGYDLSGVVDTDNNTLLANPAQPYWWHAWYHTYSQALRSELRVNYNISEKLNVVSGVEYRQNHIQGQYLYGYSSAASETSSGVDIPGGNHFYSQDLGFFAQFNYKPIEKLALVAGGRLDNNKIRSTGGYGTVFNPKLAAVFSHKKINVKFIFSQAFKDADNWTKFGTTTSRLATNPELQPERVSNIELNVNLQASSNLFFELAAYQANYSDIVGTGTTTIIDASGATVETEQHQALGAMTIRGAHLVANYKIKNYGVYFNYTFTSPYNTEREDIRVGDIASNQVNIGVNARFFDKLNVNLRSNWVGVKETGANTTISSNPLSEIPAYFLLNGAISYKLHKNISAQILINNLLDAEYFHPGVRSANGAYYASKIPQNRRNITAKLMFSF